MKEHDETSIQLTVPYLKYDVDVHSPISAFIGGPQTSGLAARQTDTLTCVTSECGDVTTSRLPPPSTRVHRLTTVHDDPA